MRMNTTRAITTFFALFDRPLSAAELSWYRRAFVCEDDFVVQEYIAPQQQVHPEFQTRYRHATRKWRRALRIAYVLQLFPWITGVGIANTLSFLHVRDNSDIDLFVITKPNRVWLARLVVAGLLRVLRLRPGEAKRDPVCPSFFVSSDGLDLQSIALPEGDSYLQFWLATLVPVWEVDRVFSKFFAANRWGTARVHHAHPPAFGWGTRLARMVLCIVDWAWVESWARRVQMRLLPASIRAAAQQTESSAVCLSSTMLKFHQNDRRAQYHEQWTQAYAQDQ